VLLGRLLIGDIEEDTDIVGNGTRVRSCSASVGSREKMEISGRFRPFGNWM
jgi:hypothetical protein